MQIIIENGHIQLLGTGLRECTFHLQPNMITIYRGFVEKKINRLHTVADEDGYIENIDLYDIMVNRKMRGCYDIAGPIANNGNQIFIINFDGESTDKLLEASILNEIQENYDQYRKEIMIELD